MSGNTARRRSRRSVLSSVFEFPAFGSSVQIRGIPMSFQITETIRILIVVLPNSQLVRSTARTQGLPKRELRRIFGDGVNQAADLVSGATSIPSRNLTPLMTFGN